MKIYLIFFLEGHYFLDIQYICAVYIQVCRSSEARVNFICRIQFLFSIEPDARGKLLHLQKMLDKLILCVQEIVTHFI